MKTQLPRKVRIICEARVVCFKRPFFLLRFFQPVDFSWNGHWMYPINSFPHNQKMAARRNQGNMLLSFLFFSLKGVERKEKG